MNTSSPDLMAAAVNREIRSERRMFSVYAALAVVPVAAAVYFLSREQAVAPASMPTPGAAVIVNDVRVDDLQKQVARIDQSQRQIAQNFDTQTAEIRQALEARPAVVPGASVQQLASLSQEVQRLRTLSGTLETIQAQVAGQQTALQQVQQRWQQDRTQFEAERASHARDLQTLKERNASLEQRMQQMQQTQQQFNRALEQSATQFRQGGAAVVR
jgi:chromosome segregation ATPase